MIVVHISCTGVCVCVCMMKCAVRVWVTGDDSTTATTHHLNMVFYRQRMQLYDHIAKSSFLQALTDGER